jgi:DNA-binding response OmpR family regulator
MYKILLVEDAQDFQLLIRKIFSHHHVIVTNDPDRVESLSIEHKVDLIILDIALPKRDGFSVLSDLQSSPELASIPVICVTGKASTSDKVTAFSLGADDFIEKPFDPIELRVRADARLAKSNKVRQQLENLSCGDLKIDFNSHVVLDVSTQKEISLTQTEYKILSHFAKHPGNVFSREQLLNMIWGNEGAVFDRAVDVHICSLRKKISGTGIIFKSVAGVGYRLELQEKNLKVSDQ